MELNPWQNVEKGREIVMGENKSIALIVDDDPAARGLASSTISMLGLEVHEAGGAVEAVQLFHSVHPDLVVLDYMMPDGDGLSVCQTLKAHEEGRYVPILMLTARDALKDKVTALEGGADDYLTKPFHYQELQARARSLLRMRDLNLQLRSKNEALREMQERLIRQERALLTHQLAGTAAHALGQPLAAILLNCHLLDQRHPGQPQLQETVEAIRQDAKRMSSMIEQLKAVDPQRTESYDDTSKILSLKERDAPQK